VRGKILNLKIEKGYGFVRPEGDTENCFFHFSDLAYGGLVWGPELLGQWVEFNSIEEPKGVRAVDIKPLG
jgi:cold shock CspA family protein